MSPHVVVRLRPGSDGDATHVPTDTRCTKVDPPTLYLEKTAQQWMQNRGEARPYVKHILETLPSGYTMWQRPRANDSTHFDKYLYGHPQGKRFDSPNRFYPHFQHLMDNAGSSFGCPCTVCIGAAGILPGSRSASNRASKASSSSSSRPSTSAKAPAASTAKVPVANPYTHGTGKQNAQISTTTSALPTAINQMKGRPKMTSTGADCSRVDEEGTPDVYRNLIDKLRRHGTIDETVVETLSPDWHAEQNVLSLSLQRLKQQQQWIPRSGEIVLYLRDLPESADFIRHEETGEIQLYDDAADTLLGCPRWEAGVVGEAPAGTVEVNTLYTANDIENVVNSGVRVEPLPDPNGKDKSLSKRHKYVQLRQVRPFVLWKELLHTTPEAQWHATVRHALSISSVLSLVGKHRFRGTWPLADIYCHGLYIGSELLAVGDTVRLLPNTKRDQVHSTDVLVISSIRLKMSNMDKASNNDYDEGRPYNSEVWVYGAAFTNDASRSDTEWLQNRTVFVPKAGNGYGQWYPLHETTKELAVPFSRILGRLYESVALNAWLTADAQKAGDLDAGRGGLLEAREFAQRNDQRIVKELDATWYWGDTRVDALDLHTLNGLDVSKYEQERDIKDLRKQLKIVKGLESQNMDAKGKRTASAAFGSDGLGRFMAPVSMSLPIRASRSPSIGSMEDTSVAGSSVGLSSRYSHLHRSDDENEDEIRQSTKVIEQQPSVEGNKARVMI